MSETKKSGLPEALARGLRKEAATKDMLRLPNPFRSELLQPIPRSFLNPFRDLRTGKLVRPQPGPHVQPRIPQQANPLAIFEKNYPWVAAGLRG